jgi:hypothetical protein
MKVVVWDHYDKPEFHEVVTDFNNIRITNDGMVFVIAFVPKGTDVPQPDWAAQLPTLGASDNGTATTPTTTIAGGTTPTTGATGSSVATTDTSVTTSGAATTTAPAPSTTGG